MEIQTLTSPSIFRFFWTVLMMLLLHEQTAYLFSTCHAREFWNFWVVNSLGEDLMKSVNWWESPCPEWDCFWHDKMQMNAASAGLIWLAGLELSQDALKLWAPGSCCSRQPQLARVKIHEDEGFYWSTRKPKNDVQETTLTILFIKGFFAATLLITPISLFRSL